MSRLPIFSPPYFSNSQAVVMVVVSSSVRHGCTVAKRRKIGPTLPLITRRKWHMPCQIRWKSLTLDDLVGQYALLSPNGAR